MAQTLKAPLRRSFSEHVKNSTNRAWDVFWKSAREKRLTEIEAKEACDWLRAAGFPQYAQLFKDAQFPINIDLVKSDHEFLDKDAIESLCRRLNTLNKCTEIRLEVKGSRSRSDDSDEEEPCAISTKWFFERQNRRWSRLEDLEFLPSPDNPLLKPQENEELPLCDEASSVHSSSSTGSESHVTSKSANETETSRSSSRCSSSNKPTSPDGSISSPPSSCELRSFSIEECIQEKPPRNKVHSLLRRMETLRLRGSSPRRGSRRKARPLIGGPVLLEGFDEEKLKQLHCVDIAELRDKPDSQPTSPAVSVSSEGSSSSSRSPSESNSTVSTPSPVTRVRSNCRRAAPQNQAQFSISKVGNTGTYCESLLSQIPNKPGTFPTALAHNILSPIDTTSVNWRTGSFHGYHSRRCQSSSSSELACSPLAALDNRASIYDNVPITCTAGVNNNDNDDDVFSELDSVMERINGLQQLVSTWTEKLSDDGDLDSPNDSTSPCPSSPKDIHLEIKQHGEADTSILERNIENHDREDLESTFDCYSALQSPQQHRRCLHWSSEQSPHAEPRSPRTERVSASRVNRLQKLSLLMLTALMDKHSPSSKQGWNWTVPKLIRKAKTTDVKDRKVFGVALLAFAQETGDPLPRSILKAIDFLRTQCLDQVGLFRKSGVKSRIQQLREMVEADPQGVSYEGQSAFDVADMVKQYFRDLPESIFTSRLCEAFLHIYQYFPKDQQFAATQAAILLLPDENREALQTLLLFLREVVDYVEENQMTPTNIAVCLAPSLFHLNTLRRESSSISKMSHRKYSLGRPDQRDLSENLAATQGLVLMVSEASRLFQVPKAMQNASGSADETLQLDWGLSSTDMDRTEERVRLDISIQNLLKEVREKYRGWVPCSSADNVDLAFRKVEDGHPLRLWKATVDVGATQEEVFHRVLREHHLWDRDLRTTQVMEVLDKDTDVYYCLREGLGARPPQEHVLLRTWHRDPGTGASILAATSTRHADAPCEGVRAHVLSCLFLAESLGTRRTRLTHLCRTDTRGRTPEWHHKVFGHLLSSETAAIRDSFRSEEKQT